MSVAYQKLYAYLVRQIADALDMMGELDMMPLMPLREKMTTALLTAEKMYLEQTEED